MNGLSLSRLALYIAGALASLAVVFNYASFDPATWEIDIYPFNIKTALTALFTFGTNGMAALAVLRGWGKR